MKKILVLPILGSFVMICSCQKQESAAEQQLAQRKVELDAREEALGERLNSLEEKVNWLDQRVKELAQKEKAAVNARSNPTETQVQIPQPCTGASRKRQDNTAAFRQGSRTLAAEG